MIAAAPLEAVPGEPLVVRPPMPGRRSRWRGAGWWLVACAVACAWDRAVWLAATSAGKPKLQWLEDLVGWETLLTLLRNLTHGSALTTLAAFGYAALYVFGRMWPWIALAMVFIFRHWAGTDGAKVREGLRRGVFVVIVPGAAGLAAEMLKLLTRRGRPELNDGFYTFKPWPHADLLSGGFWNGSGLGLASSHAAVAFGGALAAGLLLPRWRIPLFVIAMLCAASRVAVGAHFLSDVVAGVALAFASYKLFYAWDARNNHGQPLHG